jgi:hypothetical protein
MGVLRFLFNGSVCSLLNKGWGQSWEFKEKVHFSNCSFNGEITLKVFLEMESFVSNIPLLGRKFLFLACHISRIV